MPSNRSRAEHSSHLFRLRDDLIRTVNDHARRPRAGRIGQKPAVFSTSNLTAALQLLEMKTSGLAPNSPRLLNQIGDFDLRQPRGPGAFEPAQQGAALPISRQEGIGRSGCVTSSAAHSEILRNGFVDETNHVDRSAVFCVVPAKQIVEPARVDSGLQRLTDQATSLIGQPSVAFSKLKFSGLQGPDKGPLHRKGVIDEAVFAVGTLGQCPDAPTSLQVRLCQDEQFFGELLSRGLGLRGHLGSTPFGGVFGISPRQKCRTEHEGQGDKQAHFDAIVVDIHSANSCKIHPQWVRQNQKQAPKRHHQAQGSIGALGRWRVGHSETSADSFDCSVLPNRGQHRECAQNSSEDPKSATGQHEPNYKLDDGQQHNPSKAGHSGDSPEVSETEVNEGQKGEDRESQLGGLGGSERQFRSVNYGGLLFGEWIRRE